MSCPSSLKTVCVEILEGQRGPQGLVGATGQQGVQGPTGASGLSIKGDTGEASTVAGPTGATGPAGASIKGDTGERGEKGSTGQQGIQGIQGMQGNQGEVGATGASGARGSTGPVGASGLSVVGSTGATGVQGPSGVPSTVAGPQGNTGVQGPSGPASTVSGPQGATGATGPAGSASDRLTSPDLSQEVVLDNAGVVTLPAGGTIEDSAAAEGSITLTPPNAVAGQALVIRPTVGTSLTNNVPFAAGATITVTLTDAGTHISEDKTAQGGQDATWPFTITGISAGNLGSALTGTFLAEDWIFGNGNPTNVKTFNIPAESTGTGFTITLDELITQDGSIYPGYPLNGILTLTVGSVVSEATTGHLHLVAADPVNIDIYLGDDHQYVKVQRNNGDIVIGNNSNSNQWTFGTDGKLQLPVNGDVIDSDGFSILGATGSTGPQGPSGLASTVAGPQGDTGVQGPSGVPSTVSGPQGATGATGPTSTVSGPQGATGATGADSTVAGPQGATGVTGPAGVSDKYYGTSTTTLSVGNGTKTLTTQAGLSYSLGQPITIAYTGNGEHMHGVVVSYNQTTGVLVANISQHTGNGTWSNWVVNLEGVAGVAGATGATGPASTVSGPQGATGATGAVSTVSGPQGSTGATGPVATPAFAWDLTTSSGIALSTLSINGFSTADIPALYHVSIDGVNQHSDAYTLAGGILTFSETVDAAAQVEVKRPKLI